MGDPTEESMLRARTALGPFVRAFNLPVNPEDLELMAYAVLRFAESTEELLDIQRAVEEMIADHFAAHARMMEAWQAAIDERKRSTQASADLSGRASSSRSWSSLGYEQYDVRLAHLRRLCMSPLTWREFWAATLVAWPVSPVPRRVVSRSVSETGR
jgi:hypothetical protein